MHNPLLVELMASRVTIEMVRYVVRQIEKYIPVHGENPVVDGLPTPPHTPIKASSEQKTPMISLEAFICRLTRASNLQVSTLLTTLIYLERLRTTLPHLATGELKPSPLLLLFCLPAFHRIALY